MAIEIRPFSVTIPAGTAIAAKFTQSLAMPARIVTQIDVRVPPGPRGEVGFGVGSSGVIVVPYGGAAFIVTDDEVLTFPLEEQIDNGAWQFFGYNTGAYDHTIRLYFHCQLISGTGQSTAAAPPGNGDLSSGGSTTGTTPPVTTPPVETPPPVTPPVTTPPPVITPPSTGLPLTLPPALPPAPGQSAPPVAGEIEQLLTAPADSGQVWLLTQGVYVALSTQDEVNSLVAAGVPGAAVSAAMHQALYAASTAVLELDLGSEILTASLAVTRGR